MAMPAEVAAAGPEGLFLPLFPDEAGEIVRQSAELEGVVVISDAAFVDFEFLVIPESEGMCLASPDLHFESSATEVTGKNRGDLAAANSLLPMQDI